MPPTTAQHPSPAELTAFALGKLDEYMTEWVGRHLADCSTCRSVVAQTPADSLVNRLAAGPAGATGPWISVAETRSGAPPPPPIAPEDVPPALRDHPRYRLIRRLGEGGMGAVYLAEHRVMERVVAIKVINRAFVAHPEAVERFTREIKAVAKLDHPNIAKAYDAEQAGELQLLAMEYVEGKSLADVLAKKGPLPIPNACHYVRQAALGLQHAFERGMVHRDLKPQNLMLTPQGVVKVLDFGLAKLASESAKPGGGLTQDNMMMGTPQYMAPEQAVNTKGADIRADIYALGCTLYCLLTGRPPFAGDSLAVIVAHATDAPTPVESLRPDAPAELAALVQRLLAKNPNDRPQTPKELSAALLPFVKATAVKPAAVVKPATFVKPAAAKVVAPEPANESPWTELAAARKPGTRRPAKRPPWLPPAIAGGALLAIGMVAAIVMWLKVPGGVVKLEVDPPGAKVEVLDGKITVSRPGDAEPWRIELAGEKGQLKITKAGFVIETREVTLGEKGKTIRVELKPEPSKSVDGFVSIFNGRDLTGWAVDSGDSERWKVQDGQIVGTGGGSRTRGWLLSDTEYSNFVLNAEYQVAVGTDSAIAFRALPGESVDGVPHRLAVKLTRYSDPNQPRSGALFWWPESWEQPSSPVDQKLAPGWNKLTLRAQGQELRIWVNDKEVQRLSLDQFAKKEKALPGLKRSSGRIGLQQLFGKIRFRMIEIKELPPTAGANSTPAAPAVPPPVLAPAAGFVPLFNGKDLSGWEGLPGCWRIEDGVLIGSTLPEGVTRGTFLCSRRKYQDFELSCEARLKGATANSGIQIRSEVVDAARFLVRGPQADMGQQFWGSLYDEGGGGMFAQVPAAVVKRLLRPNEFNSYRVRVMGKHVTIVLNGETTVDGDFPTIPDDGIIAWQLHSGAAMEAAFRNIEIKELPPAAGTGPAAVLSTAPPPVPPVKTADGFVPLFNGKDLAGWEPFPGGGAKWAVEDGAIVGRGKPGLLFTQRGNYSDFHVLAKAKINSGGNSGLFFRMPFTRDSTAGYEAQIEADGRDRQKTGSLYGLASVSVAPHRPDEWFTLEVIARGNRIQILVDGKQTADYTDSKPRSRKGFFALQQHDEKTVVRFSKIEIKELPEGGADADAGPAAVPLPAPQPPAPAAKSLTADLGGGVAMAFVRIPAGSFTMGSPKSEQDYVTKQFFNGKRPGDLDLETQHEVTISKPFYLAIHSVTVGQFRKFVQATAYQTEAESSREGTYAGAGTESTEFKTNKDRNWRSPGFTQDDGHPVTCVSWNDVVKFCEWLRRRDGQTYRLPTEAEWEYSCRGGRPSNQPFGIGDGKSLSSTQANFNGNHPYGGAPKGPYLERTSPVGSYRPNDWGLYDMHGNVLQWCSDRYGEYPSGSV